MSETTLSHQTEQALKDFMASLPDEQQTTVANAFQDLLASSVAANAITTNDQASAFELPDVKRRHPFAWYSPGGRARRTELLQRVVVPFLQSRT